MASRSGPEEFVNLLAALVGDAGGSDLPYVRAGGKVYVLHDSDVPAYMLPD